MSKEEFIEEVTKWSHNRYNSYIFKDLKYSPSTLTVYEENVVYVNDVLNEMKVCSFDEFLKYMIEV